MSLGRFALHHLSRTPAASIFSDDWAVLYDMACVTGRLAEARGWLEKAFVLGEVKKLTMRPRPRS